MFRVLAFGAVLLLALVIARAVEDLRPQESVVVKAIEVSPLHQYLRGSLHGLPPDTPK
jgi:hypothetical protein